MKNAWVVDDEKTILQSPFITIVEQNSRSSEDSRRGRFVVMRSRDWANVIPVTEDGKVVLVRQWRQGIGHHTLEIPGGVMDPEDGEVQKAAIREMAEETGYEPLPGARTVTLASLYSNPALFNNQCHGFIVGPVRKNLTQKLDANEMIEVIEVPIDEIPDFLMERNGIDHALIVNAFLALVYRLNHGPDLLKKSLREFTRAHQT